MWDPSSACWWLCCWPTGLRGDRWKHEPTPTLMRCTADLCEQGKRQCPCPAACEVAEDELEFERRQMQALTLWVCVLLVVLGFLIGYLWGWIQ